MSRIMIIDSKGRIRRDDRQGEQRAGQLARDRAAIDAGAPAIRNLADLRRALTMGRRVQTHYYPDTGLSRALGDRGDPPVRAVVVVQGNGVAFEACEWSKGRVSWLYFHKANGYIFDGSARVVVRSDDDGVSPPLFEYTILGDA